MAQFETIAVGEYAGFGIAAFGTAAFGGLGNAWTLPPLNVPSNEPSDEDWLAREEIVQRRRGAVVGARKYATQRKYRMAFSAADYDTIQSLKTYYNEGVFYLVPDEVNTPEVRVKVYWGGDFKPERLRGPYWRMEFTLEEVLS